jgi:hypothetical protein
MDNVNSSITSLPHKLEPINPNKSVELKAVEGKFLSDQKSISSCQLVNRIALEDYHKLSKSAVNLSDLKNVQFKR